MKENKQPLLLGAHISTAGGLHRAFDRGESIGCTAMQIFTKSNRQWKCAPLTQEEISQFKERQKKSPIESVVVHAAYLINIASANPLVVAKSKEALRVELERCEQLDIPFLVLHPGSNKDKKSLTQIALHLDDILKNSPGKTMILLETMAGQGSNLCSSFQEIATVYNASNYKDRLGICFDTCHAFAAGYDISTPSGYEETWKEFDEILGFDLLKAIHINDSKKPLGSRVDRHENIAKGQIGAAAFSLLFNDKRFFHIPKILETPKDSLEEDLMNMQTIQSLLTDKTRQVLEDMIPERVIEAKSKQ